MLEMRAHCDRCTAPLPASSSQALVCSYECTFCTACDAAALHGVCPNCGGELVPRPRRAEKTNSASE